MSASRESKRDLPLIIHYFVGHTVHEFELSQPSSNRVVIRVESSRKLDRKRTRKTEEDCSKKQLLVVLLAGQQHNKASGGGVGGVGFRTQTRSIFQCVAWQNEAFFLAAKQSQAE